MKPRFPFALALAIVALALAAACRQEAPRLHTEAVAAGQGDLATELFRRAALCDPTSGDYVNHLAIAAARAGKWELGPWARARPQR